MKNIFLEIRINTNCRKYLFNKKKRTNLRATIGYIKRNARIFIGHTANDYLPMSLHKRDMIQGRV